MTTSTITMSKVHTVRFLTIDGAAGPAKYSKIVDVAASREDYLDLINRAADSDSMPAGDDVEPPVSGLDIDLAKATGTWAFVLRLPDFSGDSELVFLAEPVVALATNFANPVKYLDAIAGHGADKNRWASFVCDLDHARGSPLADGIRLAADRNPQHRHRRAMTIPFMLNVVDRKLGCAPWMVPTESDAAPLDEHLVVLTHGGAHPLMFTHGGAHPMFASFLVVDLD